MRICLHCFRFCLCMCTFFYYVYGVTQYLLNQLKNIIFEMNFAGKYSTHAYISLLIPDKHLFLLNSLSTFTPHAATMAMANAKYGNENMRPKMTMAFGNDNKRHTHRAHARTHTHTHRRTHFMNNIYGLCSNSFAQFAAFRRIFVKIY